MYGNNSRYYEHALLRTGAKSPVDVTKKLMETTPANTDTRHYRKTPAEEHSHRNILNLMTKQAYYFAPHKVLSNFVVD